MGRSGATISLTVTAVVSAALATAGCKAFDETLLRDATVDAAPACALHEPPPRPTVEDGESIDDLLFAVRDVIIDQRDDAWTTLGYDLDGLCSIEPEPDVECRAPALSAPPEIDGEGGIDNAMGHVVLPVLLLARPDFQGHARRGLDKGYGSILLRIHDWNGTPEDPSVEVTFMQAKFGLAEPFPEPIETVREEDGLLFVNGVAVERPEWDGGDVFWARPDGFVNGDVERPFLVDDSAYVTGGTLVMHLPDRFPFQLSGDATGVVFSLTDVTLTVELDPDHEHVHDLMVVGRYPLADFLANIHYAGVCPGTSDYDSLSRLLDLAADVRELPGTGGPGTTCNAVSLAVPFESGVLATLGGALEPFPTPDPCADGGMGDGGVDGSTTGDGGMPDGSVDGSTTTTDGGAADADAGA